MIGDKPEKENELKKSYLGDGVYAIQEPYGFWLHANDHQYPTDKIYIEPEVFDALIKFALSIGYIIKT